MTAQLIADETQQLVERVMRIRPSTMDNGQYEVSEQATRDLRDPSLYINRELSTLALITRIFEEAITPENPLLERVKFLGICGVVLDEFYETRVAALRDQLVTGLIFEAGRDALTPQEQLALIHEFVQHHVALKRRLLREILLPSLHDEGVHLLDYDRLTPAARSELRRYFDREIFPILTPLAVDAGHPFPHISSFSLNLLVILRGPGGERRARVKVPPRLPRLVPVPMHLLDQQALPVERRGQTRATAGATDPPAVAFTWLEQVIAANVDELFPGMEVVETYFFRVTRNAGLPLREAESENLLQTIEESLERRFFGYVVRLAIDERMPPDLRVWLAERLKIDQDAIHVVETPLGLADVSALARIDRPDLKDPPFVAILPEEWPRDGSSVLDLIAQRDVLVHHPYDSFAPVIDFVRSGSIDPAVLAIKQTLYRVGANSPIVDALLESRDDDTQVAVLVELKARGDEESNIGWARQLEQTGVHVAYGLVGLKTHCKLTLIVRREADGLRRYAHLGTGNYNAQTARLYTDLGLFTADPDICADVADVFNQLTGYSSQHEFRKLLVAPQNMRRQLLELIERETAHGERGRLIFKMNALVDAEMIEALYRVSQAGVTIDLIVRAACCLRPGVPGVSENIRVISIIDRFLEHSRIFYFANGAAGAATGTDLLYLGSADLMPRNLNRRVEVLFPLEAADLKERVRDGLLPLLLRDNVKARELGPDGVYSARARGASVVRAQEVLLGNATTLARP